MNNFNKPINIEANKQLELQMVKSIKTILDEGSFVKPLSEFYNGTNESAFGLWMGAEGNTNINGYPIADYYDYNNCEGCPELKTWMENNNMYLTWYDCGTIFLYFK
jgi:hypothetical protein